MAGLHRFTINQNIQNDTRQEKLKFIQLNLQHSRLATDNLTKIIDEENTDILCLQEPYEIRNKIAGMPRRLKIFTAGQGRHRAAIAVNNNHLGTILIKQLSDEDTVVLEITFSDLKMIIASLYFDITRHIEIDLRKIEKITQHAKGAGVLIAIDSNSRSSSWHDTITNERGRILEEFLLSQQLYILNEESHQTTFRSTRGASNIDITVTNVRLLSTVTDWEISDQESCSDHSIIRYVMGQRTAPHLGKNKDETRYKVNNVGKQKFQENLIRLTEQKFFKNQNAADVVEMDNILSIRATQEPDANKLVDEFYEVLEEACRSSFLTLRASKSNSARRTVPWWSEELTIMRKRLNALRRRFQRTKDNDELRTQRRIQYTEAKTNYATKIRKSKSLSWREYCNMTTHINPWNEAYRLAAGKRKSATLITTLRKPDGTLTEDLHETLKHMLEHFAPEDNQHDDSDLHKQARTLSMEPIYTEDDKEFTVQEIRNAVTSLGEKKAPGVDGITAEIYKGAFKLFPNYITALYNECLKKGTFPTRWKRAKVIPVTKPGKENSDEVSKFRPISLLNIGGKILEKVLINRINHHANSHDFLNTHQYGFTPQKDTTDAAMEIKNYVMEGLAGGEVIALISLDVKGAFDAAFWPSILNGLRACECPKNLYNLTKSYFSNRTAIISYNGIQIEKEVSRGCPQGSCSGPGYWNIQYNSLLNLAYKDKTKVVAFADDLILAIRADSIRALENYSNGELSKITVWSKANKTKFNEEKSKVMLISRRKRKESRALNVYLNNKKLKQVTTLKYLGIIMDHKFTFKEHIAYVTDRCVKLIHGLSRAAKVTWGIKHDAMKTIYKGAILPLLLYGAPVWIEAMKRAYNKRKYIRIQRLINIQTAKAFRTTSNEALCILTGITPITIKTEEAVRIYNARKIRGSQPQEIDYVVEHKNWQHPADGDIIIEEDTNDSTVLAYTDGSKSELGVGSGTVIYLGNKIVTQIKARLDSKCSNNQAEQIAIINALEAVATLNIPECNSRTAMVYTDSRITLDALQNPRNHAYLIEEIRKRVVTLQESNWEIKFSWVKAHVGIPGNETADKLAKEAARSRVIDITFSRIPMSSVHHEIQLESIKKWQKEWQNCTKALTTKQFFPSVEERLKKKIKITQKVAAMLTGHGRTRAYLHRFKIRDNAQCVCQQGDQTVDHLLYDCSLLEAQRRILIKKVTKNGQWPTNKHELITKHLEPLITYIEAIDFDIL